MPGMVGVDGLPIIAWFTIGIATLNTLLMSSISAIHPREAGPNAWALGNMLGAVGITILTLRTPQNEPLVALCGNAMFIAGYIGLWIGCARFKLRAPPWRVIAAVVALWLPIFLWYLLVEPDATMRALVMALALAIFCGGIALTMLRGIEPGLLQTQAFLGMLFGTLAALYLLRAAAALTGALNRSDFGAGPLGSGIFILPALAALLATVAFALMLSQRLQQRLVDTTQTDALTGLLNRGLIDQLGAKEVSRARRHGYGLAVIVFDLDHFETFNKYHGYAAGDAAMQQIARLAGACLRREDYLARLEGASFCIMLPSTRLSGAQQLAERLRQHIAGNLQNPETESLNMTASFGIAALGLHADDWPSMIQRAQAALDRAKIEGRNRIEVAPLSEAAFQPQA